VSRDILTTFGSPLVVPGRIQSQFSEQLPVLGEHPDVQIGDED
jgi:hypothetical protein